jgi:MFS family permease
MASQRSKYDTQTERRESRLGIYYKWMALSNTTLGGLMAGIDTSILLISLPAIFNGLGINALGAGNSDLLLWLLMGYTISSSIFLLTIGRLSDMFGRVRIYNFGFLIFAIASTMLYVSSLYVSGTAGAMSLIILRILQGIGGSFLMANSAAILTDAFPKEERGKAIGINQIAVVGGSLIGLIIGGILSAIDWHLIFLVSVPVGIVGTVWAYLGLHEIATLDPTRKFDLIGNITFAAGVLLVLIGLTYLIIPSSGTSYAYLFVIAGALFMAVFAYLEMHAEHPMFSLGLFRIRAFAAGNMSQFLAGIARGGMQFLIIIWLQGIWLPLHGISFEQAPLHAAIAMLPLTIGFLLTGPISGFLSDKFGTRVFKTTGMLINCGGFMLMALLPTNFNYYAFAPIIFLLGAGQGMFSSPNATSIMNSVPPERRGVASGMRVTFLNLSNMFSIVIFFTLLTAGIAAQLPSAIYNGLVAQNVSAHVAKNISELPTSTALFAALLGSNPMKTLIPANTLASLPQQKQQQIIGLSFFPNLISAPFQSGLRLVMYFSAFIAFIAAAASMVKGSRYIND